MLALKSAVGVYNETFFVSVKRYTAKTVYNQNYPIHI